MATNSFPFAWGSRTYVMGILNVTPDSFSGDGFIALNRDSQVRESSEFNSLVDEVAVPATLAAARRMVAAGVDILDVGGESTRPGAEPVSVEDEVERVVPVIRALADELDVILSVDTYKAAVAEAALQAGALLVNDVWGLKADPDLGGVVARAHAPIILMHNRSSWANAEVRARLGGRYVGMPYGDLIVDIQRELMESVQLAQSAGIPTDHIVLDPGIGFGKTVEQNLELLDRLSEFKSLNYPLLVGPSRKSFIGYTLDLPPDQRLEGTAAAVAIAIARGADIIRVHDVAFMIKVARMTDAIVRRAGSN